MDTGKNEHFKEILAISKRLNSLLTSEQKAMYPDWGVQCGMMASDVYDASGVLPLDLEKLMSFPDSDFLHDVFGIHRHYDFVQRIMNDCFAPRCTKEEKDI